MNLNFLKKDEDSYQVKNLDTKSIEEVIELINLAKKIDAFFMITLTLKDYKIDLESKDIVDIKMPKGKSEIIINTSDSMVTKQTTISIENIDHIGVMVNTTIMKEG